MLNYLIPILLVLVAYALIRGLGSLVGNKSKDSNYYMRLRIILQAVAIVIIFIVFAI